MVGYRRVCRVCCGELGDVLAGISRDRYSYYEAYYLSIIADKIRLQTKHTALLDAVRALRDMNDEKLGGTVTWVPISNALTRIIDQHECPPITDIPASVTKRVGTGSVTKTVTMTPDE